MKLAVTTDASLSAILDAEARHIADAAGHAVEKAATALRDELRAQTRDALGPNLERAWTFKRFPARGDKITHAALVYSKARKIVEAFSADTTITVRNARWLVLPLDAAIERGLDKVQRGHRSNVDAAVAALGPLTFVALPNNRALLVARQRGGKPLPVFLLVKRVQLTKRLDIAGPAAHTGDRMRDAFLSDVGAA